MPKAEGQRGEGILPPPPENEVVIAQKIVLSKNDIKGNVGRVETADIIKGAMEELPAHYEVRGIGATIASNQPFRILLLHVGEDQEELPISFPAWAGSVVIPGISTNPLLHDQKSTWDGENTHSVSFNGSPAKLRCKASGGSVDLLVCFYGTASSDPEVVMQLQMTVAKNWSQVIKKIGGQNVSMGTDSSIYEGQSFPKNAAVQSTIQIKQGAKVKRPPPSSSGIRKSGKPKNNKKKSSKVKSKGRFGSKKSAPKKAGKAQKSKSKSKHSKSKSKSKKVGKKTLKALVNHMKSSAWD